MDKSWQRNFLAFLALVGAIMGTVSYFYTPKSSREPAAESAAAELEARLESERKTILEFVIARTSTAESKLDAIANTLQDFKVETREGLKKLDDRIYEMQRRKSASAEAVEVENIDGG
jgi:gas vesicle protein